MAERRAVVAASVGLHARPAMLFTQAAARQPVPVTIALPEGDPVDARSILMVMTLAAGHGQEVVLRAEGDGAEEALDELAGVLAIDHDAPGAAG